ncbi:hypothetical protein EDB89DRAFT_652596 [Lactarius sanguifluus]|nr:hypothetical protein EDB89DRAFT_652596 [Lactarius sanguifluus]
MPRLLPISSHLHSIYLYLPFRKQALPPRYNTPLLWHFLWYCWCAFRLFVYLGMIHASRVQLRKLRKTSINHSSHCRLQILASSSRLCWLLLLLPSFLTPVVTLHPAIVASAAQAVETEKSRHLGLAARDT